MSLYWRAHSHFPRRSASNFPDKTNEAVVAASLLDSVLLKRPLRNREVDLLNET
jgi:hypothetical protein